MPTPKTQTEPKAKTHSQPVITGADILVEALIRQGVDTIFAYPGMGQLVLQSVIARDYPIVQATVLVVAALYSAVTLMVDATYVVLDPRVRRG